MHKIAAKYGGLSGGAENGIKGYQLIYMISDIRDFSQGIIIIGKNQQHGASEHGKNLLRLFSGIWKVEVGALSTLTLRPNHISFKISAAEIKHIYDGREML